MKFLDKLGLIIFSNFILILSIVLCLLIFGWLEIETVHFFVKEVLSDTTASNVVLGVAIFCILLAIKCIFFTSEEKKINGIKDGILLKNDDGQLVISKSTLEEMVTNVVKGFDSAQDVNTRIVLDQEKKIIIYVMMTVKENAQIKELSNNLKNKIKNTIKSASDLEVKEVNISIKNLHQEKEQSVE